MLFPLLLPRLACAEVALGVLGAWRSFPTDLLAVLAAHLDFQKHLQPELLERPLKAV